VDKTSERRKKAAETRALARQKREAEESALDLFARTQAKANGEGAGAGGAKEGIQRDSEAPGGSEPVPVPRPEKRKRKQALPKKASARKRDNPSHARKGRTAAHGRKRNARRVPPKPYVDSPAPEGSGAEGTDRHEKLEEAIRNAREILTMAYADLVQVIATLDQHGKAKARPLLEDTIEHLEVAKHLLV
jgi:hypothetical protein